MKEFLKADLHIHSYYSKDSLSSPGSILRLAKKRGLEMLAICDHNTIRGGLAAKKLEPRYGIKVIVGTEIKTDAGDIIGLNVTREIASRKWREVIAEIKAQHGIVVLPHPYRDHKNLLDIAECVDFIEVFNSKGNEIQDQKANELALKLHKRLIAGSDAHLISEVGNCVVMMSRDLADTKDIIEKQYSKTFNLYVSQIIKMTRKLQFIRLVVLSFRLLLRKAGLTVSQTDSSTPQAD